MTARDRLLIALLRFMGVIDLVAILAIVMPTSWMEIAHVEMGLGPLPRAPLVEYLTRSASASYAVHGALVLFLSFDVVRYRPVIAFLAYAAILHGVTLFAIDVAARLPVFWVIAEGPTYLAVGTLVLYLQRSSHVDQPRSG